MAANTAKMLTQALLQATGGMQLLQAGQLEDFAQDQQSTWASQRLSARVMMAS